MVLGVSAASLHERRSLQDVALGDHHTHFCCVTIVRKDDQDAVGDWKSLSYWYDINPISRLQPLNQQYDKRQRPLQADLLTFHKWQK